MKNIEQNASIRKYAGMSAVTCRKREVGGITLQFFMSSIISELGIAGRTRTKETYSSALRSFMQYRQGDDILLSEFNSVIVMDYESYLMNVRGIKRNSSSFYMRILRAMYNRAVERGMVADCKPFKNVYTGVDKTVKRAIPLKAIKRIKNLQLSSFPELELARDLFMFSFYTRGMSFVDMAYLKSRNLNMGVLTYRRRKTGQQLHVKWERCMQEIVDRHGNGVRGFLLPIITKEDKKEHLQYQSALSLINTRLKQVGALAGVEVPLSTYVARHSWATIARNRNIPLGVISESLGHDCETTIRIYLASLETSLVDKANLVVINALQEK